MPFNAEQQRIIDAYLSAGDVGESDEPSITLVVTKRQLRLMLEAIDHYRATKCPLEEKGEECALVSWMESAPTGAIQRVCTADCENWLASLIEDKIPASLPPSTT